MPVLVAENVAASTFEEAEKRQVVVIASAELRKLRKLREMGKRASGGSS